MPSQQTVVALHGGMTNHAFIILDFLRGLVGKYHIICPDFPGHAGYSAETASSSSPWRRRNSAGVKPNSA
ncbi:MAG TPA: hypothetical protein EYQ27_21655 [Gemmatimonadetes bacterium]|nr:hypothetical protein [Gemmatimonadota bacterium]